MDYCFTPLSGFLAIPKGAPLTETQHQLKEALRQTSRKTIFGSYIHDGLDGNFRQLIAELKEQQHQAPNALLKAIGAKAFNLLNQL